MRVGIKNSVELIASLTMASGDYGQPFCLGQTIVDRLRLPSFDKVKPWESIVKRLVAKDIVGIVHKRKLGRFVSINWAVFAKDDLRPMLTGPAGPLARIVARPAAAYAVHSVTSAPLTLGTDRESIARELEVLEVAAGALGEEHSEKLQKCVQSTRRYLARLDSMVESAKRKLRFEKICKDINSYGRMGFELSDREYAQHSDARGLLQSMVKEGFEAVIARRMIAEAAEISPTFVPNKYLKNYTA